MAAHSKGEVNRAGAHLAARLREVRDGIHPALVGTADEDDVRAKELVEWWIGEHVLPRLQVHDVVLDLAPPLDLGGSSLQLVTSRSKRFATVVDKLDREPGNLSQMVDLGGVRAVVETMDDVMSSRNGWRTPSASLGRRTG